MRAKPIAFAAGGAHSDRRPRSSDLAGDARSGCTSIGSDATEAPRAEQAATRPPLDEAFGGRLADAFRDDTLMLANVIGRDPLSATQNTGHDIALERRSGGPPPASDRIASEARS